MIQAVNLQVRKIKLIAECTACVVLHSRIQWGFYDICATYINASTVRENVHS